MYKVQLSPETIKVLENFTNINPGMLFRPGNILATITPSTMSVFARVEVKEVFESEFGLYNLSSFLSILKNYGTPDIEIHEKYLEIVEGNKKYTYGFSSPSLIVFPPDSIVSAQPKEQNATASFTLTSNNFQFLNKVSNGSENNLKERAIFADGKNLILKALDSSNKESNFQDIIVADCDKVFNLIFKEENLPLIEGDYKVDIFKDKRVARFQGPIEYFVKYEASSTI